MWQSFDELPVLIAEDSEDDLLLLQRALRKAGVRNPQLRMSSGREAIDYLEKSSSFGAEEPFPVILFLDLVMPRVSGIAVLEWLRDHSHPPLNVVLHTGVEDDDLLETARERGASYYLPKGSRPEAIREVFERAREEWEQAHLLEH
jgi:CheY-like chemotaxis protein